MGPAHKANIEYEPISGIPGVINTDRVADYLQTKCIDRLQSPLKCWLRDKVVAKGIELLFGDITLGHLVDNHGASCCMELTIYYRLNWTVHLVAKAWLVHVDPELLCSVTIN